MESPERVYYVAWYFNLREDRLREEIFRSYRSIGVLAQLCGAIALILEHAKEIATSLEDQVSLFEDFKATQPLSPEMLEPRIRALKESALKSA